MLKKYKDVLNLEYIDIEDDYSMYFNIFEDITLTLKMIEFLENAEVDCENYEDDYVEYGSCWYKVSSAGTSYSFTENYKKSKKAQDQITYVFLDDCENELTNRKMVNRLKKLGVEKEDSKKLLDEIIQHCKEIAINELNELVQKDDVGYFLKKIESISEEIC